MSFELQLKSIFKRMIERFTKKPLREDLKLCAGETIKMITVRSRLGYGVKKTGAKKEKFAPLKESTIRRRKQMGLHPATSPGKSNITATGEMLFSMRIKDFTDTSVTIGPTGGRDDGKDNEDVGAYTEAGSRNRAPRPFLNLHDLDLKKLQRFYEKLLQRGLKKV